MSSLGNEGDRALNKYEGMFLLDNGKLRNAPEKGEEAIKATLEKNGVTIVQMGQWDERRLAYEINRQKRGVYVMAHIEAPVGALEEVSRDLRLGGLISRHLFLRLKEFPPFMTAREMDDAYGSSEFKKPSPGARRPDRPAPAATKEAAPAAPAATDEATPAAAEEAAPAAAEEAAPAATEEAAPVSESPVEEKSADEAATEETTAPAADGAEESSDDGATDEAAPESETKE